MKKIKYLSIMFFSLVNFVLYGGGTDYKKIQEIIHDPLLVPLKIRINQLNKGNLVKNFSFEKGKNKPEHWEFIGSNVYWVTIESKKYKNSDVFKGKRAVKIERKEIQNETDKVGEGVLSDFIPVIPGNYMFTYHVKLKNIYPNRWRLGTKLFDSINIRMYFYDKDKKLIDPKTLYPYYQVYIDNSFKGYSFSNFWNIVKFGWGKVRARTYNYPFSEGDIPENCRFVRLFLGLKGRGEMWVDDVELKYSKWNFTPKERISKYFNKSLTKGDLLIPTPKYISKNGEIVEYKHKKIFIYVKKDNSNTLKTAISLLRKKLNTGVIIINEFFNIPENSIIFSLGDVKLPNEIREKIKSMMDKIKGKQQGYIIGKPDKDKLLFVLKGNTDLGVYYAVTTLVQLIDGRSKTYTHYNIIDYPDFLGRSFLLTDFNNIDRIKTIKEDIMRLSQYKLNKVYNSYNEWGKDWKHPGEVFIRAIKKTGMVAKETGVVDFALMINPYFHFKYEQKVSSMDEKTKYYFTHSDRTSIEALKEDIKIGMDAGAKTLMLMSDDFVPHEADYRKIYSLWNDKDKKRFTNLQNAQAYMIKILYNWLAKDYPKTRFEFCPPWYLNEFIDKSRGKAEQYFSDLVEQIPEDIAIVWTGNTVRSLSFDMADIERYRKLIGRYPMLWDNTLYARTLSGVYGGYPAYYPEKITLCNLFEPYDIYLPPDFYKYNDGAHIYFNGSANSEIYKIKYATVADYTWNNNSYDPDFSIWKVLYVNFGRKMAIDLINFNNLYWKTFQRVRKGEIAFLNNNYEEYREELKRAKELLKKLEKNMRILKKAMSKMNKTLVNELNLKLESLRNRFFKLKAGKGIKPLGKAQI